MVFEIDNKYLDEAEKFDKCIIEFYAPWCMTCKLISDTLVDVSNEYLDVKFLKINVEEYKDCIRLFDLKTLPTFIYAEKGVIKKKLEGYKDRTSILQLLE